ncbi:ParA family protein [Thioalkalivibrio paradoxus]|uniref:ParaA family ATPase n=1 Tax=Thioalkalivibrio paradoxus ARh 1 TaxID=713585 RepID=W0DG15_9GAMM|nr:ParA family protein [Thioalkalivibrio paradoxus]AHE97296.1 ParaA family ATPase [Thioalkalivibrio paradoxus ARh 1]
MKTLAIYNLKGGVGKTASAVNLAYLAAQYGWKTLLWDLDPQAAATWYLGLEAGVQGSVKKLARGKRDWTDSVQATAWPRLSCLPADFDNRHLDQYLRKAEHPAFQVRRLLKAFEPEFDLVVLDCPPSFSTVTENLFHAADLIAVPIIPSQLSLRSYEQMVGFLQGEKIRRVKLYPFLSMVDNRRKQHREGGIALRDEIPNLLATAIPYAAAVEAMGRHRAPLPVHQPRARATQAFEQLWLEIAEKLHREA